MTNKTDDNLEKQIEQLRKKAEIEKHIEERNANERVQQEQRSRRQREINKKKKEDASKPKEFATYFETVKVDKHGKRIIKIPKEFVYPELTLEEQKAKLSEINEQIRLNRNESVGADRDKRLLKLQEELHRIQYCYIKLPPLKIAREFNWIPILSDGRFDLWLTWKDGKTVYKEPEMLKELLYHDVDKIEYNEFGEPTKVYGRMKKINGLKVVMPVEVEGLVPEGLKKLISKELSEDLSRAHETIREQSTKISLLEQSNKKLEENFDVERALFEQKISELLQAVEDAQLKNRIKKMFRINS